MRFRGRKAKPKAKSKKDDQEDYCPSSEQESSEEESESSKVKIEEEFQAISQEEEIDMIEDDLPSKRNKWSKGSKYGKQDNKKRVKKKKTKSNEMNQDSSESILQIRDKDENLKEYVRPTFIRRWDGVSNQIQITQEEYDDMGRMLQVYWRTKCMNMKAVVFLQFGKMEYLCFEDDAILMNELTKKKMRTSFKFLMVSFFFQEIKAVKQDLFQRKIPCLVMNQIEDDEYKQKYGIRRRQVQDVVTPAIHPNQQSSSTARQRLLLAIYRLAGTFSYIVLDGQTNEFYIDENIQDPNFHQTRRILNRYRPVELILPRNAHDEIIQIARQICDPFIVNLKINLDNSNIGNFLKRVVGDTGAPVLRKLLKSFKDEGEIEGTQFSRFRTTMVLSLVDQYISELSLREKIFNQGLFLEGDSQAFRAPFFDSQVYQNLQIFRLKITEEQSYCKPGTLLHFVDHCKTQQGRKALHKWLDCPPSMLKDVRYRQDAISELVQSQNALKYHDRMVAFEKLGRKLGDIYHWVQRSSEKGKNILTKSINFEKQYDLKKNPAVVRIRQMLEAVRILKQYQNFLNELASCRFQSQLLLDKITLHKIKNIHKMKWEQLDKIKGLPLISQVADEVFRGVKYDQITGNIEPSFGECQIYDENKQHFDKTVENLDKELTRWKDFFNCPKVKFVSVRAKNEIEVPKSFIKAQGKSNPHKDLIFSSEIAASIRFVTAQSSALSEELAEYEQAMAKAYEPFLQKLLQDFCKFRGLWDRYVQSSAWIDGLMSLAETSRRMPVKCLPQFRQNGVKIISAVHPSLTEVLDKVVPNSLILEENQKVLLLTGPNMGGKSTLLKQTCLLVILAQLGCYVPAIQYSAPIFDQIFCRIGASDRILQGKSTFYVELEETKRILSKSTKNSLAVIDELGRGTSTFDGMAIAESVLDYLIHSVGSMTLFSTHYNQITQRYFNNSMVKMGKMGYQFDDVGLVFTYQLDRGIAERSFASNIVTMVGAPSEILDISAKRSAQISQETKRKKLLRDACDFGGLFKTDKVNSKVFQDEKIPENIKASLSKTDLGSSKKAKNLRSTRNSGAVSRRR